MTHRMSVMFRRFCVIVAILSAASTAQVAKGDEPLLSVDAARYLTWEALKVNRADGPDVRLTLVEDPSAPKDFYRFEATWPNPEGSPVLGFYAVNAWTGDVWKTVVCKRVTSPAIREMQKMIRVRSKNRAKEYEMLPNRNGCY